MVTTEEKIERFIKERNWSKAIRTAVRENCSEDCQRKILEHLVDQKLISFESSFEQPDNKSLSIISIYLFFRICSSLRRDKNENAIPNRMYFGRNKYGEIIEVVVSNDFKSLLKYNEIVRYFLYKKRPNNLKLCLVCIYFFFGDSFDFFKFFLGGFIPYCFPCFNG